MKKTFCILLITAMLLLSSCSTTITTSINTGEPETTENTPITVPIYEATETTEPEPTVDLKSIRYTFYPCGGQEAIKSGDIILDHNGNPITVDEELIYTNEMFAYRKLSDSTAPNKKTLEVNGKEYTLNYVEAFNHYLGKGLMVWHYEFSDDSVEIKAEFIEKRLIGLSYTLKNNEEKGNFTVEEAVRKAKEYLSSLYYYKTNMDKYVLSYITKGNGSISLAYNCSDTGEELYIDFDSMGRIVNFDIKSDKLFEPQEVELFREKIENARKAVEATLADGYELEDMGIYYGVFIYPDTGEMLTDVWLIDGSIIEDDFYHAHSFPTYINIE